MFQIMYNMGGGTGSGLGTRILISLQDNYPDKVDCIHAVLPRFKQYENQIRTIKPVYSCLFAMNIMLEIYGGQGITFIYDNQALLNICQNVTIKLNHLAIQ